jgi:hypothetical protein
MKNEDLQFLSVAERMGVVKNTYLRPETGDPGVGIGVYAMALFVSGFGDQHGSLHCAVAQGRLSRLSFATSRLSFPFACSSSFNRFAEFRSERVRNC